MKSIILLVLIGIIVGLEATNYCSKTLCGDKKHIACDNSGNFAGSCPPDRKLEEMTANLKTAILKKHNQFRNTLANGILSGYQPSSRMATMQWDDELATLAALNVKTCKFAHDACHNTDKYPQSGQNLAQTWSSKKFSSSTESIMLPLIDSWWTEYKDATMKEINSYPEHFKAVIGHFTVMAVDSNNRVGCAAATFRDPGSDNWYSLLLACNYAKNNIYNEKIYTSGKTASQCKSGTNPNFKGLCSENEKY